MLAVAGGSELFSKTQQVFFDRNQSKVKRVSVCVCDFMCVCLLVDCWHACTVRPHLSAPQISSSLAFHSSVY